MSPFLINLHKLTPEAHSPSVLPNSSHTDPRLIYIEREHKKQHKTRQSEQFKMERLYKKIARLSFKHRLTMLWNTMPTWVKIIRTSTHLKAIWNIIIRPSITLPLRRKAYLFWMRTNVFIIIKCWSHILHNIRNTLVYISLFICLSSFFVIRIVGALRNLVILGHNIWYHWIS